MIRCCLSNLCWWVLLRRYRPLNSLDVQTSYCHSVTVLDIDYVRALASVSGLIINTDVSFQCCLHSFLVHVPDVSSSAMKWTPPGKRRHEKPNKKGTWRRTVWTERDWIKLEYQRAGSAGQELMRRP